MLLVLGWCIVFKFNLLPGTIGMNGIYLLVAGGVAYTIGTIFYGLQAKNTLYALYLASMDLTW